MEGMNEIVESGMLSHEDTLRDARNQLSKLGLYFFLGIFFNKLVQIGAARLVSEFWPALLENANASMIIAAALQYLVGMPLIILLVKRIPAAKLPQKSMKAGHFFMAYLMCVAISYVSNIVGNVFTGIVGVLKGGMVENVALTMGSETSLFLNFLVMVICAPLYEEYIFRKLIVDRTRQYGQSVAILMSGLMFGLAHGNLNQFAYAFTIGMFFAFIYVKTGKLRYTIVMHMMFNCYSGVFLMGALRHMNFGEYMKAAEAGDLMLAMQVMREALPAWIVFFALGAVAFGAWIAGIVLLIVFWKKFALEKGEIVIPKGKRFRTVFLNVGILLYCLYFIVCIVMQLFS